LNKHVDVILVCKMNEMVGIKMAIVLVWDEILYSWIGKNERYGFNMELEWGWTTEVSMGF